MTQPKPNPGVASGDRTGRFVIQPNGHLTPLSPHMGIWRWHVTMAASILFRATLIAASVGLVFVVAWLGALEPGIGHAYRVQGSTFLIEFVNVQPDAEGTPANHIHCVWRDMTGDFDLPAR